MIKGYATKAGTASYAARFPDAATGHFRSVDSLGGLFLSSIGLGTYLGEPTAAADEGYHHAITAALRLGCNVIDSSINYRFQRSERSIGSALSELTAGADGLSREEIILCTKGGFVPFDGGYPHDAAGWIRDNVIAPGLATPDEILGGAHCMTPKYLKDQVARSLENLSVACIDVYYVHNPEFQLEHVPHEDFMQRLTGAFMALEEEVAAGRIRSYGTATWNGYRVSPDAADEYLSLEQVLQCAVTAGGAEHNFRAIQLPVNLAMPEALIARNQQLGGSVMTILEAAAEAGIAVFASGSLLQARLTRGIPPAIATRFPSDFTTDAARALQFARSVPGVTTALVGMGTPNHAEENLALVQQPPFTGSHFAEIFS